LYQRLEDYLKDNVADLAVQLALATLPRANLTKKFLGLCFEDGYLNITEKV